MGCGSSTLKGEKNDGLSEMRPARKVQTNFSDVNFNSGAAADRRGTMAVAPDENQRPSRVSEASADAAPDAPASPTKTKSDGEGAKLEPYKTIEGGENARTEALLPKSQPAPEIQPDGVHMSTEAGNTGNLPTNA